MEMMVDGRARMDSAQPRTRVLSLGAGAQRDLARVAAPPLDHVLSAASRVVASHHWYE